MERLSGSFPWDPPSPDPLLGKTNFKDQVICKAQHQRNKKTLIDRVSYELSALESLGDFTKLKRNTGVLTPEIRIQLV